jgi:hypothetical protein
VAAGGTVVQAAAQVPHATVLQVVLAVGLGSAFLGMFYKAVSVQWPESYFAASDTGAYNVSVSPGRYLSFRFLPVFATCLFVAVTVNRLKGPALLAALSVAAIHAGSTVGVAVVRDLRAPAAIRRHRAPVTLLRAVTLATVFAVAALANAVKLSAAPLVPSLHDLAATLWTGAIAAIAGAYAISVSRGRTNRPDDLVARSYRSIPRSLRDYARTVAAEHDADADLVVAVMIAENLQRPRWFRRIEWVKSKVLRAGTYGIMQVQSEHYLSDRDSIRIAVQDRLANLRPTDPEGRPDYSALQVIASSWNPDPTYDQLLVSAYYFVHGSS